MICPYCSFKWVSFPLDHCPKCNKSISDEDVDLNKVVTKKEMLLIPLKGFLAIIVLYFFLEIVTLPFSNAFFLGMFSALFMDYKLFWYWIESLNFSLNKFFPYFKEYLFLCSLLIMFFAIMVKLVVDYIAVGKAIEFGFLGAFILNYFIGFIAGMVVMFLYFFNIILAQRRIKKRELPEKSAS